MNTNCFVTKPPLLTGDSVNHKRAELKQYFQKTWAHYDNLFSLINDDQAYFLRPERLRHPLIFYFGHTATFYINKLILGKFISKRVNGKFEAICAVGVDEMSWDDLNSAHYDWPSVDEVRNYRVEVAQRIEDLIDSMPLSLPIKSNSLAWIILMGCEHERIHIETSSVIMRMLPIQYLSEHENWPTCAETASAPKNELLTVAEKKIILGKPKSATTFGWDNEYGKNEQQVASFKTSKYLVSNQEFLTFIEDNGYKILDYWTEEGQQWLRFSKAIMPRFWLKKDDQYWQRNLTNEIPLPLDWPVEVNYLEAKAFCNWKSKKSASFIRLPTESEWLCLREKISTDLTHWKTAPGNINSEFYASSCPVNRFETEGFFDIIGNVWQWSESAIDGFTGFEVHPLYDDFSTPTFDGKHNLIKGGSWISTGNEATKHSRYAFRRHFFQHAGFRYVQSEQERIPLLTVNKYETNADVCQQLDAHYGKILTTEVIATEHYPKQIVDHVLRYISKAQVSTDKCLDLGCSVGRASFMLAAHFEHIDGVDFSARYIQHGVQLQQGKAVRYVMENEGELVDYHEVALTDLEFNTSNNIYFSQGDASNLKAILTGYDVVIAQHVLENTYDPQRFLENIQTRINPQGLLIIISDYKFDHEKLSKNKRIGGIKVNGENVTGFDGLSLLLQDSFTFLAEHQLSRVLKRNQRNFHLSFPHLTVWQKNN